MAHPFQAKPPALPMVRDPHARNVAVLATSATDAARRWCLLTNASTQGVIGGTSWFG
jgi:hypothetical protein